RDDDADLRGKVLGHLVQVELDGLARDASDPAHDELLAERRSEVVDDSLHGRVAGGSREERLRVLRTRGDRGREDLVRERDELLVLRHEVRLAVDLDEDARLPGVRVDHGTGDEAVGSRTSLALADALESLDADDLERLLGVAVGLVEGLLDVEHASAGALTERLDVSGGVVRHGDPSLVRSWSLG